MVRTRRVMILQAASQTEWLVIRTPVPNAELRTIVNAGRGGTLNVDESESEIGLNLGLRLRLALLGAGRGGS